MKVTILIVVFIIVAIALIIEGILSDESKLAFDSAKNYYKNSDVQNTESAKLFNDTGALLLSSEEELTVIRDNYLEQLRKVSEDHHDAFLIKSREKNPQTVASKVRHIASKSDTNTIFELQSIVNSNNARINGEASISDERTILDHILRTEKYNFNNVIWKSFVKSENGVEEEGMTFQLDDISSLKFPANDINDTENANHNISFFASKILPYMQSWYIPLDMALGTFDLQDDENINIKFAYDIIANAYHEVEVDRYKVETLSRTNNYRVYDKTTTINTYVKDENGEWVFSSKSDPVVEKDIRESVTTSDTLSYRWDYVVSNAKMFDYVISSKYNFSPYYKHSIDTYYSYINKVTDMTADEFSEIEKKDSKADTFIHSDEVYYDRSKSSEESDETLTVTTVIKTGKSYTDVYTWSDKLDFADTQSGIYNTDSVVDVTGEELNDDEYEYYNYLYRKGQMNLIDLMNSSKDIYKDYVDVDILNKETPRISIRRNLLESAYNLLKKDLTRLFDEYPLNTMKYNQSIVPESARRVNLYDYSDLGEAFAWPLDKINAVSLTSCAGGRYDPINGIWDSGHGADDYAAPAGTAVIAAKDGEVVTSKYNSGGYGNYVVIDHGDNWRTLYAHMRDPSNLKVGDKVKAGDIVGYVGTTGRSTGNHLHFAITHNNEPKEPLLYIDTSTMPESLPIKTGGCPDKSEWGALAVVKTTSPEGGNTSDTDSTSSGSYSGFGKLSKPGTLSGRDAAIDTMNDVEIMSRLIWGEQGTNLEESKVLVGISILNNAKKLGSVKAVAKSTYSGGNGQVFHKYNAVDDNAFWSDIPQGSVDAAKKAIEIVNNKGTYIVDGVECINVEAFKGDNNKSKLTESWYAWSRKIILKNTSGLTYTAFYGY